jgi:hypothetical protein
MRTYSTPQSALNGEITKLAIIECVASAALYIGLGVYLGTFKSLAVAVVFAPFMLFRTESSADWGMRLYKRFFDYIDTWASFKSDHFLREIVIILISMLLVFVAPVVGTIIRIVATIYWAVRTPLHTLKEVPRNWLRQCLCTDFAHPPEIVPKEAVADAETVASFTSFLNDLRLSSGFTRGGIVFIALPLLILGWIPSVIYRISFKATALAYIPFLWVAHSTLWNPLPLKARLERFTKGELEKVRRGISYLILSTLVAKGALVVNWIDRGKVESMFPSQKIVTDFVVLDDWPWWQITFGADALLTFILLFFADAALSRIEGQRPWREESVMTSVDTLSFLRASLGIVTMAHFFNIALMAAAPDPIRRLLTF